MLHKLVCCQYLHLSNSFPMTLQLSNSALTWASDLFSYTPTHCLTLDSPCSKRHANKCSHFPHQPMRGTLFNGGAKRVFKSNTYFLSDSRPNKRLSVKAAMTSTCSTQFLTVQSSIFPCQLSPQKLAWWNKPDCCVHHSISLHILAWHSS